MAFDRVGSRRAPTVFSRIGWGGRGTSKSGDDQLCVWERGEEFSNQTLSSKGIIQSRPERGAKDPRGSKVILRLILGWLNLISSGTDWFGSIGNGRAERLFPVSSPSSSLSIEEDGVGMGWSGLTDETDEGAIPMGLVERGIGSECQVVRVVVACVRIGGRLASGSRSVWSRLIFHRSKGDWGRHKKGEASCLRGGHAACSHSMVGKKGDCRSMNEN